MLFMKKRRYVLSRKRKKTLRKVFAKKPWWLTALCVIVSMIALAGIVWIIRDTHMYQKTLITIEGSFDRYEVITDTYVVPTGIRTNKGICTLMMRST